MLITDFIIFYHGHSKPQVNLSMLITDFIVFFWHSKPQVNLSILITDFILFSYTLNGPSSLNLYHSKWPQPLYILSQMLNLCTIQQPKAWANKALQQKCKGSTQFKDWKCSVCSISAKCKEMDPGNSPWKNKCKIIQNKDYQRWSLH